MKKVLHVNIADPAASLARFKVAAEALQAGKRPSEWHGVSFQNVAQMLAVFTPRRMELIATLREHGPMTTAALARLLGRNYKNVHGDVAALVEWLALEKGADGLVIAPYSRIELDIEFPQQKAA